MPRLRLTLAYDGRPWLGWQGQKHGLGIQNQLESALAKVAQSSVLTEAAGRTDAGVHALGQVVHCDVAAPLREHQWLRALNDQLPASIRVMQCAEVAESFHARFSAVGKCYLYRISTAAVLDPFLHGRVWHVPGGLDVALLQQCGSTLLGTHAFRRLSSRREDVSEPSDDPERTRRTLHEVQSRAVGDELEIEFYGNGFLYRMVRVLVGTMIHISRGRDSLATLQDMLHDPTGARSTQCAPPCGLYLKQVLYAADAGC
jgi:tRNA pseudouridine38-40 synthase